MECGVRREQSNQCFLGNSQAGLGPCAGQEGLREPAGPEGRGQDLPLETRSRPESGQGEVTAGLAHEALPASGSQGAGRSGCPGTNSRPVPHVYFGTR